MANTLTLNPPSGGPDLNKLTRYFVVGAILIVLGVILVAAGTAGLPPL
jgi:hypothetical protein